MIGPCSHCTLPVLKIQSPLLTAAEAGRPRRGAAEGEDAGVGDHRATSSKTEDTFGEESVAVRRLPQIVLIVSTLLGSWLGMQTVHEFGHVLGVWMTGGRVARVVL